MSALNPLAPATLNSVILDLHRAGYEASFSGFQRVVLELVGELRQR